MLYGNARPRDALERIELALALYDKASHGESARMYAEAFAEDAALAEDLAKGHRYNAACSAALASALGEADAAEWRGRALEWLSADLAALGRAPSNPAATLEQWKKDPDFAKRPRPSRRPAGTGARGVAWPLGRCRSRAGGRPARGEVTAPRARPGREESDQTGWARAATLEAPASRVGHRPNRAPNCRDLVVRLAGTLSSSNGAGQASRVTPGLRLARNDRTSRPPRAGGDHQ